MKISNHMALPLVAALVGFAGSALAADNMAFSGTLRAMPARCILTMG